MRNMRMTHIQTVQHRWGNVRNLLKGQQNSRILLDCSFKPDKDFFREVSKINQNQRTVPALYYSNSNAFIPRRTYNNNNNNSNNHNEGDQKWNFWIWAAAGSVAVGILLGHQQLLHSQVSASSLPQQKAETCEPDVHSNKKFSKAEVARHHNSKTGIWVTYKDGVYDITKFVSKHPGGNRLLMAAGSSLEPFWDLYPVHKNPEIYKTLELYRIGTLSDQDASDTSDDTVDAFSDDPVRKHNFIIRSAKPYNGETDPGLLTQDYFTPNDIFFVRNHLPVPTVDLELYTLEIEGLNVNTKALTLEDIKSLPKVQISSTIQCAGNRRHDMHSYKPVLGLQWTGGAIGNAKWTGARLVDALELAGFEIRKYTDPSKIYLRFEGLDSDPSGEAYGASIPLSYLLDGNFEAVLAYEMNGEDLPRDHGFPLRIILPGIVGARNVKWLARIEISTEESQSPWQQRDYKVFNPSVTLDSVDYSSSPPIQDLPVNSYICSHKSGQRIIRGRNIIKGYAYSGGGRDIARVEISIDKGNTWVVADINKNSMSSKWSWIQWEKDLMFSEVGATEIWVKAVDKSYNQQVETFTGIWNFRGLIATAYHKITCNVQ